MLETPYPTVEIRGVPDFLEGSGEMASMMRDFDWAATDLGAPGSWPQSLKTAVRIVLTSRYAMWMAWGPNLRFFCNDAYLPTVGIKRDWVLGSRSDKVWQEIWPDIGPRIERVLNTGEATWDEGLLLFLERLGFREETYHTFSYSPLADDKGQISGMLCVVTEETERVVGERRLSTLSHLAGRLASARAESEVLDAIKEGLDAANKDLPFALLYLHDEQGTLRLARASGIEGGHPASPAVILPGGPWPHEIPEAGSLLVDDLSARVGAALPGGVWSNPSTQAVVIPIGTKGQEKPVGCIISALNPYRKYDEVYASFLELLAGQISASLVGARAFEEERHRADALAEIDRAKTLFFSNVSHEFRTPLTLMLGPVEDALNDTSASALDSVQRQRLDVAQRNSLRLLKLVNTLLDFSRIEAGRVNANFQPTDLSDFTSELASNFHSATEKAGLKLEIHCEPLPQSVPVDRDMWEKIVFNLLSNAFKFTFEGSISVRMHAADDGKSAELVVRDTGVGIPPHEVPRLFERFHRVENQKSRSFEGSGIGLALVQELVKLHGGSLVAESEVGRGSSFKVNIPFASVQLSADSLDSGSTAMPATSRAEAYVEEALSWLPQDPTAKFPISQRDVATPDVGGNKMQGRILVADDNADMRAYIGRLLGAHWGVETAKDGNAAIEAIKRSRPDLVVTDAMMPGLDGFGLLEAIRKDPDLRDMPVIMLSARAGEEARIEGLDAGADYYLTKPFSARELVAQVNANLALARVRSDAARELRASEEALRRRTTQFETLLNEAPLGVYLVDADFKIQAVNPTALPVFGDIPDLVGRDFDEVIRILWPKDYAGEVVRLFRHTLETGEPYVTPEHIEERRDRRVREYYEWRINRIPLPAGRYGVVCYFRDISAYVRARQQRELLINELNHRVKNTLATVQSVAAQTLKGNTVPATVKSALESRLLSMAGAHDVLTQQNWEGADLRNIVKKALSPFTSPRREFDVDGPDIRLLPKSALAVAMAVHELATNAAKYGALSNGSGRISVQWAVAEQDAPHLQIVWTETGGPKVAAPSSKGFGSRLIERGLAGQLGGEAVIDYRETGVVCRIMAPLGTITGNVPAVLE
ncbi:ATP-binding protein [Bradyrhizobium sp. S69]|uniref:ATP-binding protein n=1 Tax=Bradyrhizobium sp. S69 TaxID=1641856 RepID=UPI00131D79AC|nr:ATP-binding protein [Bradyrhizobium sp. S69]